MIETRQISSIIRKMVIATDLSKYFDGDQKDELVCIVLKTDSGNIYVFEFLPGNAQTVPFEGTELKLRPANVCSVAGGDEGGYIGLDLTTRALIIGKRDDDGLLAPVLRSSSVSAYKVLTA
jgi:hypothetical protein